MNKEIMKPEDPTNNLAVIEYKKDMMKLMQLIYPNLTLSEIEEAMDWSIENRTRDVPINVYNSYKNRDSSGYLYRLTQYIMSRKPVLTSYGMMYMQHSEMPNPLNDVIQSYAADRQKFKNIMLDNQNDPEKYEMYNLFQILKKIDMNGIYGTFNEPSSFTFNLNNAASVTAQGRTSITSAILLFEGFLGDNILFASLDEVLDYIKNITDEDTSRVYKDELILDRDVTILEVFYRVMKNCGFNGYIPDIHDMDIVWIIMSRLSQENLNRIYYKNNLYAFMENKSMTRSLLYILEKLEKPFLDPNDIPYEISVELDEFTNILKEYVYYRHMFPDKLERVATMIRKVSVLTDTDSSIISLDAWYHWSLNKAVNDDKIKIKNQYVDEKKFLETGDIEVTDYEVSQRYDFYTEEFREITKATDVTKTPPQDNLKFSLINIMAYVVITKLSRDYMLFYSSTYNALDDNSCYLKIKNEFYFKRLMLMTTQKKQYATYTLLQEGRVVPEERALTIKGLPMSKVTIKKSTRDRLQKILLDSVLAPEKLDIFNVITELTKFEKDIYNSLLNGSTEYYKPYSMKAYSSYDNPLRIAPIKGALIYNATKDDDAPPIDLTERNNVDLVKIKITVSMMEEMKETDRELYDKLKDFFMMPEFKGGITAIAIPLDTKPPKWVYKYIDFNKIINDNLSNFPLSAVGLSTAESDAVTCSNILKF